MQTSLKDYQTQEPQITLSNNLKNKILSSIDHNKLDHQIIEIKDISTLETLKCGEIAYLPLPKKLSEDYRLPFYYKKQVLRIQEHFRNSNLLF